MLKKIIIYSFVICQSIYSQSLPNRIIIWDVTLSTIGLTFSKGVPTINQEKNIFDKLKNSLIKKIENIPDDGGLIHLLQFREAVKFNKTFSNDNVGRNDLLEYVKNYELFDNPINRGNTNIAGAWEDGIGLINTYASNELYLYTDGNQNVRHNGEEPKKAFHSVIEKFCNFTKKLNAVLFFVSLDAGFDEETIGLLKSCESKIIVIDLAKGENTPGIVIIKPKISPLRLNISDENLSIKQRFYTDAGFNLDKFSFDVSLQIPNATAGYLLDIKPKSYQLNSDGDVFIKFESVAGDWKKFIKVTDTLHANLILKSKYNKKDFIVAFANNGNIETIIVNKPKKTVTLKRINNDK